MIDCNSISIDPSCFSFYYFFFPPPKPAFRSSLLAHLFSRISSRASLHFPLLLSCTSLQTRAKRLSNDQSVKAASDVVDVVRLSVWRVDPVFVLNLERKLPFMDHIVPGWPCAKRLVEAVVHTIGEHWPSESRFLLELGCCCHSVRKRLRLLDRHRLAHRPLVDGVRLCNVHAEELALGCVVTLQLLEVFKDLQERGSGVRTCSHHQREVGPLIPRGGGAGHRWQPQRWRHGRG